MRRIAAALLVPATGCLVLAGCGSSSPSAGNANAAVKVTGQFDNKPAVSIPSEKPTDKLAVTTPIKGTGAELDSSNSVLAYVTLYKWSGTKHAQVVGSGPQMIPATMGLTGLETALKGAHLGSRIVAVLPPRYGWGSGGQSQLGVTGSDTTVWVLDLLSQYSPTQSATGKQLSSGGGSLPTVSAQTGKAPVIAIPKKSPPAKLSVTTLIKGTGPALAKGDTVVAQYVGSIWRTGKVFSSTWPSTSQPTGVPFSFQLGGQVLAGWNDGLVGVPVGSRVMLVIPPALGYGPANGQASAGIKKNDTLVFVVDVLGAHSAAAS